MMDMFYSDRINSARRGRIVGGIVTVASGSTSLIALLRDGDHKTAAVAGGVALLGAAYTFLKTRQTKARENEYHGYMSQKYQTYLDIYR